MLLGSLILSSGSKPTNCLIGMFTLIKKISETQNFSFDFEQLIKDKKETGNCIISFNNKMICKYDENGKLIVSNGKTLLIKNESESRRDEAAEGLQEQ